MSRILNLKFSFVAFWLLATVGSLSHDVKANPCALLLSDRAKTAIASNEWKNAFQSFWEIFPPTLRDLENLKASIHPTNPALAAGILGDPRAVAFKRLFEFLIEHHISEWPATRDFFRGKIEEESLRNVRKEEAKADTRAVFQVGAVDPIPDVPKEAREYFQKFSDGSFLFLNSSVRGKKGVWFSLLNQEIKFMPFPNSIGGKKFGSTRESVFVIQYNEKQKIHQISDKLRRTIWIIDHEKGLEFTFSYDELAVADLLPFRRKDGGIALLERSSYTGSGNDRYFVHEIPQSKKDLEKFTATLKTRIEKPILKVGATSEEVFEVADDGTPYVVQVSDRSVRWVNLETLRTQIAQDVPVGSKFYFRVMHLDENSISLAQMRLPKTQPRSLRVFDIERSKSSGAFEIKKTEWPLHEGARVFDTFEFRQGKNLRKFMVTHTEDSAGNFLLILDLSSGEIKRLSLPKDHPLVKVGGFTYAPYLLKQGESGEEPRVFIFIDHSEAPLVADLNLQTGQLITFPHEEIIKKMDTGFLNVVGVRKRDAQSWSVIIAERADVYNSSGLVLTERFEEFVIFGEVR